MAPRPIFAEPSSSNARRSPTAHSRHSFAVRNSSNTPSELDIPIVPLEPHQLMARNSSSSKPCNSCMIQDNDPRVIYTGKWVLAANGGPFGTTHTTNEKDASVSLTFNGSRIVVFGTIAKTNPNNKGPIARYIIDENRPEMRVLPVSSQQIRNQAFFAAQNLNDTSLHTLKVQMVSIQKGSPFILQHFFVRPHDLPPLPVGGDIEPVGDPSSDGDDSTGGTVANTSYNSPNVTQGSPYLLGSDVVDPMHVVRILAGVLGGVVALILLVIVFFFIRRRLAKARASGRVWSKFWRYSPGTHGRPRPDTMITSFTSTESIVQNDPSTLLRGSSAYTKSDGRSELMFAGSGFEPTPPFEPWITPPKAARY